MTDDAFTKVNPGLGDVLKREKALGLLSPTGKVLLQVAETPGATLLQMAQVIGVTESWVSKRISLLVEAGIVSRTRVSGQNVYRLNSSACLGHPDMIRLLAFLCDRALGLQKEADAISPKT